MKCPSGKIRYSNQLKAERALAKALLDNWSCARPWRREQRVYCCGRCGGGWHLTSQQVVRSPSSAADS